MKKILVTSTEASMLEFLLPHIQFLREQKHEVEIACSDVTGRFQEVIDYFGNGIKIYKISLYRSPLRIGNLRGLRQLEKIINENHYDMIWTNEPVMGVVTRMAARKKRKNGLKVMYMCHGFHFCRGGPFKNWLLYYPVERFMANYTDILVTINQEDFRRAQHFHVGKVVYVPGIGIDVKKFRLGRSSRKEMRRRLGLNETDVVLLSVGELSVRKNHRVVLEALGQLKNEKLFKNVIYLICGTGPLEREILCLAEKLGIQEHVRLLGYRHDIAGIYNCSDFFVFPSVQEVFPVAIMEAMASGLPIICSNIQKNKDFISNGIHGLVVENTPKTFSCAIKRLLSDKDAGIRFAVAAKEKIQGLDLEKIMVLMRDIYTDTMVTESEAVQCKALERVTLRQQLRNKYGINQDEIVLLSVGEVSWRKNHEAVIRAMGYLEDIPLCYVVSGKGPLISQHEKLMEKLGIKNRLIFTGYLKNVQEIYAIADIFVFPSRIEGMGLAAIEAMAAGLPIITSDIHGINDYSIDGVTGFKCAPTDYKGIAEAIRKMACDGVLRERMGQYNCEAAGKYDIRDILPLMAEICRE